MPDPCPPRSPAGAASSTRSSCAPSPPWTPSRRTWSCSARRSRKGPPRRDMPPDEAREGPASPSSSSRPDAPAEVLVAVACVSAALLMIELALTRIFSVVMYYHFAFLAISIALFGLSASGVYVYVARKRLNTVSTPALLAAHALLFAAVTVLSLAAL